MDEITSNFSIIKSLVKKLKGMIKKVPFDSHETYGSLMKLDGKISLLSHMVLTSSNNITNFVFKSKESADDLLTRLSTIPFCKKFISVVAKDLDLTDKNFLNSISTEDVENDVEMEREENEEKMELDENQARFSNNGRF